MVLRLAIKLSLFTVHLQLSVFDVDVDVDGLKDALFFYIIQTLLDFFVEFGMNEIVMQLTVHLSSKISNVRYIVIYSYLQY